MSRSRSKCKKRNCKRKINSQSKSKFINTKMYNARCRKPNVRMQLVFNLFLQLDHLKSWKSENIV